LQAAVDRAPPLSAGPSDEAGKTVAKLLVALVHGEPISWLTNIWYTINLHKRRRLGRFLKTWI
jgi:hypothetical protein